MEQGWGRANRYLELSLAEINRRIAPSEAVNSELISEGKANTNFRVSLFDGTSAVVRLYQRDPASATLERAIACQLKSEPWMPKVLAYGEDFMLSEFKPGRTMQTLIADGKHGEVLSAANEIGTALALIASVQFDRAGLLGPSEKGLIVTQPWPSAIDGYMDYLKMCLSRFLLRSRMGPEFSARFWDRMILAKPRFTEVSGQSCLVHGDFKASNLLIHEGRLSGVLDWEFAHSGLWLLSTGQVLRHPDRMPTGFAEQIAAGMATGGISVPDDWIELSKTMDLINLIDFLGQESTNETQIDEILRLVPWTSH